MKTSSSSWVPGVMASLALSALACGSRSNLDPIEGQSVGRTTGGASSLLSYTGTAGQTFTNGGNTFVYTTFYTGTRPFGGSTWGTGGARPVGGTAAHYGGSRTSGGSSPIGGTWSIGGTRFSSTAIGGTTHVGSTAIGGTTHVNSSAIGGTTQVHTTPIGSTAFGGGTHYGGTWGAGGTTPIFSAGTTSISSFGGRTNLGGTSSFGGWYTYAGGKPPTGGSSATGGITALPWTSVCKSGLTDCGTDAGVSCVDTQTDASNCGLCGHACQGGWHCDAGQCRAPACTGQFTFGRALFDARYSSGSSLSRMISADFNQDGLPDAAVCDYGANRVNILLGGHNGEFAKVASYQTGYYPQSLAAADFNGDGKLDIITANSTDQGALSVLLGNGDGTFVTNNALFPSNPVNRVAVGDLNGDNIMDLVTDSTSTYGLQVYIGVGDGTFEKPATYPSSYYSNSFALADLNGDARLDVISANTYAGSISVRFGTGSGTLAPAKDYIVGADQPISLVLGDVDNDQDIDVLVACNYPNIAVVMLNDGTGTFGTGLPYPTNGSTEATLGDLNRDGKLDMVLLEPNPNTGSETVGVRLGLGTGTFAREDLYPFSPSGSSPIVGDYDEDTLPDVIAVDTYNSAVMVLSGSGDGTFHDTASYPSTKCPYLPIATDVNRDGVLDLLSSDSYSSVDEYFGPIQGSLAPAMTYNVPASNLAVGDLDGDGNVDLVTSYYGYSWFTILFGSGGGKFGSEVDVEANSPYKIVIADMNNDGWQDLVSISSNYYVATVNLNLGNRTFSAPLTITKWSNIYDVAVGDLNGDALPDLVMTAGGTLLVTLATQNGGYSGPFTYSTGSTSWVKLADVNGDGKLDALTSVYWSAGVEVLLGQGDGSFVTGKQYLTDEYIYSRAVHDVNGDGHVDVVMITSSQTVALLMGNGDGTFSSEPASGYITAGGNDVALGDLNGDGWPDIMAPDTSTSSCRLSVMYGKCR